jgi:urease accessory protein
MATAEQIDLAGPQLALTFVRAPSGETYLKRQYARFPFHVTQPFHLDGRSDGEATVILQTVGAGLVQGDSIDMEVAVETGAHARLITQGLTVAHAMPSDRAAQCARLKVASGARLHFLPRPLILFADADVVTRLEITVGYDAHVLWCDGYLCHDTNDDGGRFRRLDAETVLRGGDGSVLAIDRFVIDGGTPDEPGVLAGFPVHAGIGFHGNADVPLLLNRLTHVLSDDRAIHAGFSALPDGRGLFGRVLARDGVALRRAMETVRDVVVALT